MGIRKHLCWLLGHRYPVIWFKPPRPKTAPEGQAGVADTEAGCIYCGFTKPNSFFMDVNNIDWRSTKHRTTPPKHRVYGKQIYRCWCGRFAKKGDGNWVHCKRHGAVLAPYGEALHPTYQETRQDGHQGLGVI